MYFILSKVFTDEDGGLSAHTGDNPIAKARGLPPYTGGQPPGITIKTKSCRCGPLVDSYSRPLLCHMVLVGNSFRLL